MLFQASRAVTVSSEMSRFIGVSECAPPSTSLLILACIETLGANSGANQLPKGWDKRLSQPASVSSEFAGTARPIRASGDCAGCRRPARLPKKFASRGSSR